MKQRIVTGIVGLILLGACMLLFNTIFFNVIIAIVAGIAIFEILSATKLLKNWFLSIICIIITVSIPFLTTDIKDLIFIIYLSLVFLAFVTLIVQHNTLSFKDMLMSVFLSFAIGLSFSTFIYVRDAYNVQDGILYILLMLGGAWLSDTGAYFTGMLFGKKKLAPEISPKKTVEGAIGGVITCVACFLIIGVIFQNIWNNSSQDNREVNYISLAIIGLVLSVLSILGDLFASVIKRQSGIKDFGNIFPGHGGVLDRFDSVLFTAPALYIIITYFSIVK